MAAASYLHAKQLSDYQAPNSSLIEQYLTALPEDSLFTPATMKLVSMGYFGRMPINGKAYKVLLHAYNQYPVKSYKLSSPWNTIRSRLLTYVDSAGALQDKQWLEEILQANEQLFAGEAEKSREKNYFLCRYYSEAMDSARFFQSVREHIAKQIQNIDLNDLYLLDTTQFVEALQIKFGTTDEMKLKKIKEYPFFRSSYLSNSRIIMGELMEMIYRAKYYFKQNLSKEVFETALSLYKITT
jgi:hypothetical protein